MKRVYLCLVGFLVLAILIFSPLNTSGQQLKLNIKLSDTAYYVSQSIWLDVELTNIRPDTVRTLQFKFPGGDVLNVVLTNERGDTLRPVFRFEFLDWSGFLLNPGETYYETFDLADIFHNYEVVPEFPAFQWTPSLTPGRYEVSGEYRFRGGRISTSRIAFEVIQPTGSVQDAFQLYVEAYKNEKRNKSSLSQQQLNKLVTSYPKSVYAERAYMRLFRVDELLEKCPDSGFLQRRLRGMTDKMSKEEKQKFLEKVIKEHPNTRSTKFAQQILRGW